MRLIGLALISLGTFIWVLAPKPDVVMVPGENVICFIENETFYATSLQKGRRKVASIQRNLGFDGRIEKRKIPWPLQDTYEDGLFIWSKTNKAMRVAKRKHPYCPAYFRSTKIKNASNIRNYLCVK
jgi:hypothetical protein